MGSIGPPFFEMFIIFPPPMSDVRERVGPIHIGMRCCSNPFFCEIFMFVVLILWVHFMFFMVFHIFYLLLIMFPSGWKLRPPELMILKLYFTCC